MEAKRFLPTSIAPTYIARLFLLSTLFTSSTLAYAQGVCIPVDGLSFERIDSLKLLASRDGKNVAIMSVTINYTSLSDPFLLSLPERLGQFRFFSAKVCEAGAEAQFQLDGKLYSVKSIQPFK